MILELGNHALNESKFEGIDDAPKVTTIHIPEFDDGSTHPDAVYEGGRHPCVDGDEPVGTLVKPGPPLGGYTHVPGLLTVDQFQREVWEAEQFRGGIYKGLAGHEAALAAHLAWREHSNERPAWLQVTPHPHGLTHPDVVTDLEGFLHEHFKTDGARKPLDIEDHYWTRFGPPGEGPPLGPPPITALYTNDGRSISNINDGGGQVGTTGAATATGTTSLTNSGAAWTTNQWASYRVIAQSSTSNMVWANVISNTATVLTVDRWYAAATPGGSAGTTPSGTSPYMVADGGMVSTWFVAMTTTNITPAAADHTLSGEYTTASGGYIRKIAPYAQTSGVATRSITLTPVYTGNGSDTYPSTFYAIGVFASMVVSFGGAGGPMKFETSLNASATVAASGDAVTITDTISGS